MFLFSFYLIKSETSDSFVNHFDGHFAYLKTLDFYFNTSLANTINIIKYKCAWVVIKAGVALPFRNLHQPTRNIYRFCISGTKNAYSIKNLELMHVTKPK